MITLTPEQREDAAYVDGLVDGDRPFCLDLSDERQFRHAIAMHSIVGHTPETRPGLHEALAAMRDLHAEEGPGGPLSAQNGWQSGGVITDLGLAPDVRSAAAAGFTGFVGGAAQVNASMVVMPTAGGDVLASGKNSDFGDGTYVPVFAAPISGELAAPAMKSTLLYSYQLEPGGPWTTEQVKREVQLGTQGDPTVEQPQKQSWTPVKANYIQVAIGRGMGPVNDCDYWLGWSPYKTVYYVPFKGNVEFVAAPPPTSQLQLNKNVFIYGNLARSTAGGAGGHMPLPSAEAQHIFNKLQTSGNTLSWSLPAPTWKPPQPSPQDHGDPINWGELPWASGERDYLTIQFQILLSDGTWGVATVQSSDTPDTDEMDGTANILPLVFVYSCLAAGTPIHMADGSEQAVEDVLKGHLVRAGDGSEREVVSSVIGRHRGRILKIDAGDGELVLSHNHVVVTPDGACFAERIKAGQMINSLHGPVEVSEVREEDYDGVLCNLSLSEPWEPAEPSRSSMFAGPAGIEVCDYEVQVAWERERRVSKEAVLAALEPMYHRDYLNSLEEKAAAS